MEFLKRLRGSLHYPPLKIMFVLEHKVGEGRITNMTKNLRYDFQSHVHLSKWSINLYHIPLNINYQKLKFSMKLLKIYKSRYKPTNEPNKNWNSSKHNTIIITYRFSDNKDNVLNPYPLQSEVNIDQPSHTPITQTIIDLIKISFSQPNLFVSLNYENLIFRHRILIKG